VVVAAIFSNTHWTFWDVMLLFFIWIPLIMLWFFAIVDIFRRRDLSGWGKALWLLVIVIFPWLGTFIYLIARPWGATAYGPDVGYPPAYGYGYPYGYPAPVGEPYGSPPPATH
jgi:hypothetical protein